MFNSILDIQKKFLKEKYIVNKDIATVVFLSCMMQKPLLIEGKAGVGKTELAKVLAKSLNKELIRMQCYEGLDETKALYEWEYSKQLLYTQILKEKINNLLEDTTTLKSAIEKIENLESAFFSEKFLLARPLLKSITNKEQVVLLIDEIDRADEEFEAFLLEVLSDFQVTIPEIGTIPAKNIPLVVLTSNATRDLSDALKRRCLHLFLDFPDKEQEIKIIKEKIPKISKGLIKRIVDFLQQIRLMDLRKHPGVAETLDWAKALTLLNVKELNKEIILQTLNVILKYEEDTLFVKERIENILSRIPTTNAELN